MRVREWSNFWDKLIFSYRPFVLQDSNQLIRRIFPIMNRIQFDALDPYLSEFNFDQFPNLLSKSIKIEKESTNFNWCAGSCQPTI